MKYVYGAAMLFALIFAVDWAIAHWQESAKRRAARKWCLSPGAFKPVQRNWWEA